MLLAIAKDSSHLVELVASEYWRDLDWTAEVAEQYGRKLEGQIHYLAESIGLQWQIGDTFLDLAVRNSKASAAAAISSARSCPSEGPPAPENSVKVALVQCASEMGAVAKNLKRLERHIRKAAEEGAKIIVLPETSVTGYLSQDLQTNWGLQDRPQSYPNSMDPAVHAEERDGDSVRHMALLARELCVYITVPYLERNGVHFCNSIALVGPESLPQAPALAHYQKNCPWPYPEKSWASPGKGIEDSTYDTPYGRVGLAICFDIHSILAKYAESKLWALLYPIAWVGQTDEWFTRELPDRLRTVNCPHYILGANWATVAPADWHGAGGSSAYGPGGRLLAHATEARFRGCEEVVLLTIPTQSAMPQIGALDKVRYASWTREQTGTDFWQK